MQTIITYPTSLDIFKDKNIVDNILSNSKIKIYTDSEFFEFDKIFISNDNIFVGDCLINFSVEFKSKIKNINLIEIFDEKTKISLTYNNFDFFAPSTNDGICSIIVANIEMISVESIKQIPKIVNFNNINFSTDILINGKNFTVYYLMSISLKKSKKLSIKFEYFSMFDNDSYMKETIDVFTKLIENSELGNNSVILCKDFKKYILNIGGDTKIKIKNNNVKLTLKI